MARFDIRKAELELYVEEFRLDAKRTADEFRFTVKIEMEDRSVCEFAWAALPFHSGSFTIIRTEHCSVHIFYTPSVVKWSARSQMTGGRPPNLNWPKNKPLLWKNPAQKDLW